MRVAVVICAAALAGCRGLLGIDDPTLAAADADLGDARADAPRCYGVAPYLVCPAQSPSGSRTFEGEQLDTDTDCTEVIDGWCVVTAGDIAIITLNPHGSHPLVILAGTSLTVNDIGATGLVAAPGANNAALCSAAGMAPGTNDKGGGGGAGGSFVTAGGDGGRGANATLGGVTAAPSQLAAGELRGGCAGQRGASGGAASGGGTAVGDPPGGGGGAIYLLAGEPLHVQGTINASGGAGGRGRAERSGGSGGGSGGMIVLWSPMMIGTATLIANGGAGGGGGAGDVANGQPGMAVAGIGAATGGNGGGNGPGKGGNGGSGSTAGVDGAQAMTQGGGGGGGGGVGVILLSGTNMFQTLMTSPPPQTL